jgi:hypothetical protein
VARLALVFDQGEPPAPLDEYVDQLGDRGIQLQVTLEIDPNDAGQSI